MKPFKTEGDAWRFLAHAYEALADGAPWVYIGDRMCIDEESGLCGALFCLACAELISWPLREQMRETMELLHDPDIIGFWWPFGDMSTRAFACAFLATLTDDKEPTHAPA